MIVAWNHNHNHIANAGIKAINGHIYGINSINQAIIDNTNTSSTYTQNNLIINNHTKVIENILNDNINWLLIQSLRAFSILFSLFFKYLELFFGKIS